MRPHFNSPYKITNIMDKIRSEIYRLIDSIKSDSSNKDQYGQVGIFNFRESVFKSRLSQEAFEQIEQNKCLYGSFSTYGGRSGTYRALTISSAFYSDRKAMREGAAILSSGTTSIF